MKSIFDEYTEEINNTVKYGVLYTNRRMTESFDRDTISPEGEEKITIALKMEALLNIKEDIMKEYSILAKQYEEMMNV